MSLKNNINNMSIKKKIFFITSLLIIVGFSVLYLIFYIFMPSIYKEYTIKVTESKIEDFIDELENNNYNNYSEVLDNFAFKNNSFITIIKGNGKVVYSSNREGFVKPKEGIEPKGSPMDHTEFMNDKRRDQVDIQEQFYFKQIDEYCNINIMVPIRVYDETKNLIKVFLPFAVFTMIIITLIISAIYSKMISNPLLEVNKKAKKMAKLDFSERFYPKGNDEIGQLSESLNIMCENLDSNIKQLEAANIKLKADIEKEKEVEKERKEFIATISHELKSPITIINGQLEGMIYNIGKYKDRDKYLKESHEVVKEMEKLVLEILDMSKRDSEDFKLNLTNANLSKTVSDILKQNYYFIEDKKLFLDEEIEPNVIKFVDNELIYKAFMNIVRNAIQHSSEGQTVRVKLTQNQFIVENSGVQIDPKEIPNLFNAFYRVDKSRNSKTGGTGLGLYIVKTILDKHESLKYHIESHDNKFIFIVDFEKEVLS